MQQRPRSRQAADDGDENAGSMSEEEKVNERQNARSRRPSHPSVELSKLAARNSSSSASTTASTSTSTSIPDKRGLRSESLLFCERVGKGASGVVHMALDMAECAIVAVKVVPVFDDEKRAQTVSELNMLHENRPGSTCPYIVGMRDAYVDRQESTINLVLEWMDGGSVQDVLDGGERFSEPQLAAMLHSVLRGAHHLHKARQLHRDIKPSNMLISNASGLVKLSDFGLSHSFGSFSAANTFVGSLSYMAPERISGDDSGYSYPADIWSIGLSALVCATGEYPFQAAHDEQGYWGLVHAISEEPSPRLDGCSPELCDLINRCLDKDPRSRPTASQLLRHPFLAQRYPFETVVGCERLGPVPNPSRQRKIFGDVVRRALDFERRHGGTALSPARVRALALQLGMSRHDPAIDARARATAAVTRT